MFTPTPLYLLIALHLVLSAGQARNGGEITDFKINSRIEHRYSITQVISKMRNTNDEASDLQFKMSIPKTGIISSFIMNIDGQNYTSIVQEEYSAKRAYPTAAQHGTQAAIVQQSETGEQMFEVSARVEGHEEAIFYLVYEELLRPKQGIYTLTVHVHPGYRIPMADIEVSILEREAILDYKILELPGQELLSDNPGARVTGGPLSAGEIRLGYHHEDPPDGTGRGVEGLFIAQYKIRRHLDGGLVQRKENYFAHFFSPEGLPTMNTHTVFLLDASNSMEGTKLSQLKESLKAILKDMPPEDTYELLVFSSDVVSLGSYNGSSRLVRKAMKRVRRLKAFGNSNLNSAFQEGLRALDAYNASSVAKQIVALTDGQATENVTDTDAICQNLRNANSAHHPIFTFALGDNAHIKLLQKISEDMSGFMFHLKTNEIVSDEAKEFFKRIPKPSLREARIAYPEYEVDPDSLVDGAPFNYHSGSEVVMAGVVIPGTRQLHPRVTGFTFNGPAQLRVDRFGSRDLLHSSETENLIARLWAYLKFQDLMAQAEIAQNLHYQLRYQDKALQIALKFNFVTKVTSLVVERPNEMFVVESWMEKEPSPTLKWPDEDGSGAVYLQDPQIFGQSPVIRTRKYTYVNREPHFILTAPGMFAPVCFDLPAHNGSYLSLIRDPQTGVIVNGLMSSMTNDSKLMHFTKLFLGLRDLNITVTPDHIEVDCMDIDGARTVHGIIDSLWPFYKRNGRRLRDPCRRRQRSGRQKVKTNKDLVKSALITDSNQRKTDINRNRHQSINDIHRSSHGRENLGRYHWGRSNKNHTSKVPNLKVQFMNQRLRRSTRINYERCQHRSSWEEGEGRVYGNVMVVLSKKKQLSITVGDGEAKFLVTRSKNTPEGHFLSFYIEDHSILSPETHGIIGQFVTKDMKRIAPDSEEVDRNNTVSTVELHVNRRNRRRKTSRAHTVSGVWSKRRSLLDNSQIDCIHIRRKGRRLIDGSPQDYKLRCLSC